MATISSSNTDIATVAPIDALWSLIQCQSKSVRKALAKRLNASIAAEKGTKIKMSEKEFYAKLDRSIESARCGRTTAMLDGETTDQFIDRILCTK